MSNNLNEIKDPLKYIAKQYMEIHDYLNIGSSGIVDSIELNKNDCMNLIKEIVNIKKSCYRLFGEHQSHIDYKIKSHLDHNKEIINERFDKIEKHLILYFDNKINSMFNVKLRELNKNDIIRITKDILQDERKKIKKDIEYDWNNRLNKWVTTMQVSFSLMKNDFDKMLRIVENINK